MVRKRTCLSFDGLKTRDSIDGKVEGELRTIKWQLVSKGGYVSRAPGCRGAWELNDKLVFCREPDALVHYFAWFYYYDVKKPPIQKVPNLVVRINLKLSEFRSRPLSRTQNTFCCSKSYIISLHFLAILVDTIILSNNFLNVSHPKSQDRDDQNPSGVSAQLCCDYREVVR
jgi:hypothetical protein